MKSIWLASCALALTGCVSADSLNKQLKSSIQSANAPIEGKCLEQGPASAKSLLPNELVAAIEGSAVKTTGSIGAGVGGASRTIDLERGRSVLLGLASQGGIGANVASSGAARMDPVVAKSLSAAGSDASSADKAADAANRAMDAVAVMIPRREQGTSGIQASSAGPTQQGRVLSFKGSDADRIQREIAFALAGDGFEHAFTQEVGRVVGGIGASAASQETRWSELAKQYYAVLYFSAYFRGGKFFSIDVSDAEIQKKLVASLTKPTDSDAVKEAMATRIKEAFSSGRSEACSALRVKSCGSIGTLGDTAFKSRSGQVFQFPGISGTLEPGGSDLIKLGDFDSKVVAPQLVRVLAEAAGDSTAGVPGVADSTACTVMGKLCPGDLTDDHIAAINERGAKVDALTLNIVGSIVRGGWLFSLNNEVAASIIESTIASSARKVAEVNSWTRLKRPNVYCPKGTDDLVIRIVP